MPDLLFDEELASAVNSVTWRPNGVGYLFGIVDGRRIYMHRYLWGLVHGGCIPRMLDHINGNKLDNRIANLRPATGSLNCRSRQRSSGGRFPEGVQPKPGKKPFVTHICLWRATLYLGSFYDIDAASAAYENARAIILACEATRAADGDSHQPIPPHARSSERHRWNVGWREILSSRDFESAVRLACDFARQFVPHCQEVAA